MGALDGWASAAIGGGVTGLGTGLALWVTISHDRHVRRDDRINAAALRATEMCTDLAQEVTELAPDMTLIARQYFRFTAGHMTLVAHLGKRHRKFRRILDAVVGDLLSRLGPGPGSLEGAYDAIAASTSAYIRAMHRWFEDPRAFQRGEIDLASIRSAAGILADPG